jgi:hypothetical protein
MSETPHGKIQGVFAAFPVNFFDFYDYYFFQFELNPLEYSKLNDGSMNYKNF